MDRRVDTVAVVWIRVLKNKTQMGSVHFRFILNSLWL